MAPAAKAVAAPVQVNTNLLPAARLPRETRAGARTSLRTRATCSGSASGRAPPPVRRPPAPVAAPPAPPPQPQGPPPIPPITLLLIGLHTGGDGRPLAVLKDPKTNVTFMGSEGMVVDGQYKVVKVGVTSVVLSYVDGTGQRTIPLR